MSRPAVADRAFETAIDISTGGLSLGYLMLIVPLSLLLVYRAGGAGQFLVSALRMTVQLLFVGLYLEVVFRLDRWWLTALWVLVMTSVADFSVIRTAGLRGKMFFLPLFVAIFIGSALPVGYFINVIIESPRLLEPRYVIPIMGMIMGNCLKAAIIATGRFYRSINEGKGAFVFDIGRGASLKEAVMPFLARALNEALGPTIATMTTIGLVALPGMMTGIIMAGLDPFAAVKYQISIIIAIVTGTALTVVLSVRLTMKYCFTPYGVLRDDIFRIK